MCLRQKYMIDAMNMSLVRDQCSDTRRKNKTKKNKPLKEGGKFCTFDLGVNLLLNPRNDLNMSCSAGVIRW